MGITSLSEGRYALISRTAVGYGESTSVSTPRSAVTVSLTGPLQDGVLMELGNPLLSSGSAIKWPMGCSGPDGTATLFTSSVL